MQNRGILMNNRIFLGRMEQNVLPCFSFFNLHMSVYLSVCLFILVCMTVCLSFCRVLAQRTP